MGRPQIVSFGCVNATLVEPLVQDRKRLHAVVGQRLHALIESWSHLPGCLRRAAWCSWRTSATSECCNCMQGTRGYKRLVPADVSLNPACRTCLFAQAQRAQSARYLQLAPARAQALCRVGGRASRIGRVRVENPVSRSAYAARSQLPRVKLHLRTSGRCICLTRLARDVSDGFAAGQACRAQRWRERCAACRGEQHHSASTYRGAVTCMHTF